MLKKIFTIIRKTNNNTLAFYCPQSCIVGIIKLLMAMPSWRHQFYELCLFDLIIKYLQRHIIKSRAIKKDLNDSYVWNLNTEYIWAVFRSFFVTCLPNYSSIQIPSLSYLADICAEKTFVNDATQRGNGEVWGTVA